MKQNVKIFLIALIIGGIASYLVCYKFDNTIITNAIDAKVTYFYVGAYNTEDAALNKSSKYNNSIIYKENGLYKVLIGVYKKSESVELMGSYFMDKGIDYKIGETRVSGEFLNLSDNYESLIKTSDTSFYENLNKSLLQLFNEYIN